MGKLQLYKVGKITLSLVGLLGAFKGNYGLKLDLVSGPEVSFKENHVWGTGIVPGEYNFLLESKFQFCSIPGSNSKLQLSTDFMVCVSLAVSCIALI